MKTNGYKIHVEFLSLASADLAVARVAARVRDGGHDVPEEVIRRRFVRGLANFFTLYQPIADSWQVLDNAAIDGPKLIAFKRLGGMMEVVDESAWLNLVEVAK